LQEPVLTAKAWGGRFSAATDKKVEQFTESISCDRRLWQHDIAGSIAHAEMLSQVGVITEAERDQIVAGLTEIAREIEAGTFPFRSDREDIHMNIEGALIDRLGDVGRKLHTARSRNDQVATDLRLWTRDALDQIDQLILALERALLESARRERDVILPGYTHMQRAQPVLAAHYFLAYIEKFERDRTRLADCRKRVNVLPLGSAALAGTTLPIDRQAVRSKLGFDAVSANSIDACSDRDFAIEFVFCLCLIAEHLAGWADEWVLWTTTEFGFIELPDAYCTGSSIMPQKKNPDVLELIRGKSARVIGCLQTLLVLVKGLPLTYNRDLQEDKPALFDAFDTVATCLDLAALIVGGARLCRDRIAERLEDGFLDATTLMEYLIRRGVAMREAHEVVGRLVRLCEQRRCRLKDLTPDDFANAHSSFDESVSNWLGVQNAVKSFQSEGSTGPGHVDVELTKWSARLF
jgi:argininosuccinate lyase